MRVRSLALAALLLAAPAFADSIEDRVSAELVAQGYVVVTMERTWFGRLRVVADLDGTRREIVLNPVTGEILRDYSALIAPPGPPATSGGRRSRDHDSRGDDAVATVDRPGAAPPSAARPAVAEADPPDDAAVSTQVLIPEALAVERP